MRHEDQREGAMGEPLLEVENLHTYFHTADGVVKAVRGVSFEVPDESVIGIVGESGSGKTVTGLSIMGLVPRPGNVEEGSIRFDGRDLLELSEAEMRPLRGREVAMVFQDAASALNPVITIGEQIQEVLQVHTDMSMKRSSDMTVELMRQMGIANGREMLDRHPWEISGGMAQRVMLAMGLALSPRLLVADEPTSNLDVTVQAEILHRLNEHRRETGSSVILITHDLGVMAQMADRVLVMYGGYKLEEADTLTLYGRPMHPYTNGLLDAVPRFDRPVKRLTPIRGVLPSALDAPDRCPFLDRCARALSVCRTGPMPELDEPEPGHRIACYNPIPAGARRAS